MDSMEMELARTPSTENNGIPPAKKAIVLPILGKKKTLTDNKEDHSSSEMEPSKKRGPGRPKKSNKPPGTPDVVTIDDQPPELEPQVTIPPIKKRTQPEEQKPVSKPKPKSAKGSESKPKQMSIMAFVQKKKEEALEKRVSGCLSPASSSQEEEIKKEKKQASPKPTNDAKPKEPLGAK